MAVMLTILNGVQNMAQTTTTVKAQPIRSAVCVGVAFTQVFESNSIPTAFIAELPLLAFFTSSLTSPFEGFVTIYNMCVFAVGTAMTTRVGVWGCNDLPGDIQADPWSDGTNGCAVYEQNTGWCAKYGANNYNREGAASAKCCACGGGDVIGTSSFRV